MGRKTRLIVLQVMLVAILYIMYVVGRFRDIARFAHVSELVVFLAVVIGIYILILLLRLAVFRRILFKGMGNIPILRNAEPADYPQLDTQTFDRYDGQLTSLGFEPRFCFGSESIGNVKAFARLYYHPVHRCLATNGQLFQGSARMATTVVMSQLDDKWSFSTSSVRPHPLHCLWRRPRVLWNAIPGAEPRELLDTHLHLRQRMIDGLDIDNATTDIEQPAYFERQMDNQRQNWEQLKSKNIIHLYFAFEFYTIKPIYSWMGDLEKAIKNR